MQFTVDTQNSTAFELNALAEFVNQLAAAAVGSPVLKGPQDAQAGKGCSDSHINVEVHLPEGYSASVTEGNAASGAPDLPPAAGPAPELPPVLGSTSVAAAPESTSPPAVPAAPTSVPAAPASTPEAAPAAGQADLDSAGCPWSPLIHTSNKATIGDGTWRKKPGVDPAYFESVRNELMGKQTAITATETDTSTPSPTSAPVSAVPDVPEAPALLTGNDVMARAMEIQMADPAKGAPLFQAIQGAGIPAGPMGLPGCTDQAVLAAALAAVNAVGAQ